MGLLQKAVETYDAMAGRVGIVYEQEKEPLAPISHMMARAHIEITLDQNGKFVSARTVRDEESRIIIPATEKSTGGRSGMKPPSHPLCDEIKYLAPYDAEKHRSYVKQLEHWANSDFSHPKLNAILKYIQGKSILQDLSQFNIIQLESGGKPVNEKLLVRWVVNGLGEEFSGPCWTDISLMQSFIRYYATTRKSDIPPTLCMVSGSVELPVVKHPKGIIPGAVTLISSNDEQGFTFRGRFDSAWQAATVGYIASQKAHNALRWLVANQGIPYGGRTFLCWNPQGIQIPKVTGPMGRKGGATVQRSANPSQYQKQLREALSGWKENLPQSASVVITAFDAPSNPGRLAVTYYNELLASDFLDRLHDWEVSCCWENGPYGIQSPSLFQIVSWAFGTPRNGKSEPDDRILRQQMQRLMACRVDRAPFPLDVERALMEKASHLLLYEGEPRQKLLFTACAAIRKYHYDHLKEEWDMALDKNCSDRSYLFGRLLAVADAIENSTYTEEDRRETNAIRMQKIFTLRPMATWSALWAKLAPYNRRLAQSKPKLYRYYQNTIDDILDRLSPSDSTLNQQLDDIYLLGYSHQRAYRNEKPDQKETEEES